MAESIQRVTHSPEIANIDFDEVEVRRQIEERLRQSPEPLPYDPVILRDLKVKAEKIASALYVIGSKIRKIGVPEFNRTCGRLDESFVENLPHRVVRYFDHHEKRGILNGILPLQRLADELSSTLPDVNWAVVSGHFADAFDGCASPYEMLLDRIEATLNDQAELRAVERRYQLGLLERISNGITRTPTVKEDLVATTRHHDRDLWILDLRNKNLTRKQILNQLKNHSKILSGVWDPIESEQGISAAVKKARKLLPKNHDKTQD